MDSDESQSENDSSSVLQHISLDRSDPMRTTPARYIPYFELSLSGCLQHFDLRCWDDRPAACSFLFDLVSALQSNS
jgi:hypothetical protein